MLLEQIESTYKVIGAYLITAGGPGNLILLTSYLIWSFRNDPEFDTLANSNIFDIVEAYKLVKNTPEMSEICQKCINHFDLMYKNELQKRRAHLN